MPIPRRRKCKWCGKELDLSKRGRPKTYCSHSCRQRAYEARQRTENVTDEQMSMLMDRLFELRCQAEDIETACREGVEPAEMTALCQELVHIARKIETHPSIVKMLERTK
ncbi:MAG: hypothetical protein Q3962_01745 [Corynebacterium sp.]|nr:hypothetical protein [Corynebacterium sp.]